MDGAPDGVGDDGLGGGEGHGAEAGEPAAGEFVGGAHDDDVVGPGG